jgi:hypothetical protein
MHPAPKGTMNIMIKNVILFLLVLTLMTGCVVGEDVPETSKTLVTNKVPILEQKPLVTASPSNIKPSDIQPEQPKQPVDIETENPFQDSLADIWHYFLFELFRGAEEVVIDDWFKYKNEYYFEDIDSRFIVEVEYPRLNNNFDSDFLTKLNNYYYDRLNQTQKKEYTSDEWIGSNWHEEYRQEIYGVYTFENIISVIIKESRLGSRSFFTPLGDNFDIRTGKRLDLSDLFTVGYDVYSERISSALRKVIADEEFILFPGYEEGNTPVPLPAEENFLITPNGLAIIYGIGEISAMAARAVVLYVEYEDIADILDTAIFPPI